MKKLSFPTIRLDTLRTHRGFSMLWLIGVGIALVGMIMVTIYAVYAFFAVLEVDVVPATDDASVESISRESLSRSVRIIEARMDDFERLKNNPPKLPDPAR